MMLMEAAVEFVIFKSMPTTVLRLCCVFVGVVTTQKYIKS